VHFYLGSGPGATYSTTTPSEASLWATQAAINTYDMVYFACQGADYEKTAAEQSIVETYANAGGRVLATHYSYVWFYNQNDTVTPANSFSKAATWAVDPMALNVFATDPGTGIINVAFTRGQTLSQWLQAVGATPTPGQVAISTLRHDFTGAMGSSLLWLTDTDTTLGTVPMQLTFDTPFGNQPANQCGRVLYTDYHVDNGVTSNTTFPAECVAGAMSPQEKMMEYMIFDLGACIGP
jgi:hypothetical protein